MASEAAAEGGVGRRAAEQSQRQGPGQYQALRAARLSAPQSLSQSSTFYFPVHQHPFSQHVNSMEPLTPSDTTTAAKRKRSPSASSAPLSAPAPKVSKSVSQLSINYLARQSQEDLPLLNKDDTLANLLQLLTAYSNVLDRHESLASNLGARPLGPILIKRFERCFDAPPKVVASHHKGSPTSLEDSGHQITWLEVIEFARSHPSQFTLSTYSEGRRVCQFYYPQKQLRVQISEEDFLFINSGRCQELIPPLPIWEDEEKEVGTCDVLEAKLKELTNAADMIAARTRQLSHRLKGRRAAILERRAEGGSGTPAKASAVQTTTAPGSGFTPVNTANGRSSGDGDASTASFAGVRTELLKHFEGLPQNQSQGRPHSRHHSIATYSDAQQPPKHVDTSAEHAGSGDRAPSATSSLSPVPTSLTNDAYNHSNAEAALSHSHPLPTPHSSGHRASISMGGGHAYNAGHAPVKHNFSRPLPPALESTQPFRPLCQAHMDGLPRGTRVLPPCDRCRRLRMDCVKNLTSCAGCTKKHARCHWRDVSRDELGELDHLMESAYADNAASGAHSAADHDFERELNGYVNGENERVGSEIDDHHDDYEESDDDDSNPLEDLEALGEKEEQRMREDEEGLRNARELSRQGREESIRVSQADQLVSSEPAAASAVPNGVSESHCTTTNHADGDAVPAQPCHAQKSTDLPLESLYEHHHRAERPHADSNAVFSQARPAESSTDLPFESPSEDHHQHAEKSYVAPALEPLYAEPPARGGFRAVNEPRMNGEMPTNGTGWRIA